MLLGVRAGDGVDRLLLFLQWTNDLPQMPRFVGEVGADDIFPRWADAQAVCRLVVAPKERLCHIDADSGSETFLR